ncbi:MAG: IS91 family transposase [Candidatus Binatia bacterium]
MLPVADQAAARPKCELAHVFREYGADYRRTHRLPFSHRRVMQAIENCRTSALGGHMEQCNVCGFQHPAYDSCRNRHCPKCQCLTKARWLEKQKSKLLPVGAFHLVFTLTHKLNPLILVNKRVLYNLLFQAVSETLLAFARTHLWGTPGFICVLHTWDQQLQDHFHLHCLFPKGALSFDQNRWIPTRKNFLFRVEPLSTVFRGKFLDFLEKAFEQHKLIFPGKTAPLADPANFSLLLKRLRKKPWVVYAKKPFGSPQHLLDYLGRYVHRVALSNDRILSVHNGEVTFTYRDRKDGDRLKIRKLPVEEFIRRFLLHVLPRRFMRIRRFGFFANHSKKPLSRCRQLLGLNPDPPAITKKSTHQLMLQLTGIDITRCPRCKTGTLVFLARLPACKSDPAPWDSS